METIGRNLKALREREGITQQQLADALGVTVTSVSGWETRGTYPRKSAVDAIKHTYNVTEDDLFSSTHGLYAKLYGLTPITPQASDSYAPVFGIIAAGDPSEAFEQTGETHWVSPEVQQRYPDGFFLRVIGDSMDRVLPDSCYAYIAPCEVKSGDIAAVKVNGDEATIKRVRLTDGLVILEPESSNSEHRRRIIDEHDPDAPYVRMLGKVVWYDVEF